MSRISNNAKITSANAGTCCFQYRSPPRAMIHGGRYVTRLTSVPAPPGRRCCSTGGITSGPAGGRGRTGARARPARPVLLSLCESFVSAATLMSHTGPAGQLGQASSFVENYVTSGPTDGVANHCMFAN